MVFTYGLVFLEIHAVSVASYLLSDELVLVITRNSDKNVPVFSNRFYKVLVIITTRVSNTAVSVDFHRKLGF